MQLNLRQTKIKLYFQDTLMYHCDIYLPSYKEWNCYGWFKAVTNSLNIADYNNKSTKIGFHTHYNI